MLDTGLLSAAGDHSHCTGCRAHPDPTCAACGQPAAVALACGSCAMPLCLACSALVRQIRAETAGMPRVGVSVKARERTRTAKPARRARKARAKVSAA